MTDLTKTAALYTDPIGGTYPVRYCNITEKYFVKIKKRWLEVRFEHGEWVQTGVQMPMNLKGREYQ